MSCGTPHHKAAARGIEYTEKYAFMAAQLSDSHDFTLALIPFEIAYTVVVLGLYWTFQYITVDFRVLITRE